MTTLKPMLLLACASAPEPTPADGPPAASVDETPYGAAFVAQMWGDDISPEQTRRFEQVAGKLLAEEADLVALRADRVANFFRMLAAKEGSATAAEASGGAVAEMDRRIAWARARGLCELVNTLSPAQREARRVAERTVPLFTEALPRSATNSFDFAAPLLRRQAAEVQAQSRRIDAAWAPVAAAVAAAEAQLPLLNIGKETWCDEWMDVVEPVTDAWAGWHRASLGSFGRWFVVQPEETRAAFLDGGGLDEALRWSMGNPKGDEPAE